MARILHLDDDPSNLTLTKLILERAGHYVISVHNLPLAEKTLAIMPIDLVIADGDPPQPGAGAEFARKLHAVGMKTIIVSGSDDNRIPGVKFVHRTDWDADRMVQIVQEVLRV